MSGVVKGDIISSSRLTSSAGGVESGTKMIFHQTAAPTGWTKLTVTGTGSTAINDVGLRIVTGTITDGIGGTVAFDTAFASQAVASHTLSSSEIPSHTHGVPEEALPWGGSGQRKVIVSQSANINYYMNTNGGTGGGGGHTHTSIDLNVKYIDLILASKD